MNHSSPPEGHGCAGEDLPVPDVGDWRSISLVGDQWREDDDRRTNPFVLAPANAHVWRLSLLASPDRVNALGRTLSMDERIRADGFRFEVHRRRFVVGRGAVRELLGPYLDRAPAEIAFAYGPNGKPSLASSSSARAVFFNVSHSEDVMLCAITIAGEIGIDVERVRAISEWPDVARLTFTQDSGAAPPDTLEEFYREWTRHEARVKAAGHGLAGRPDPERQWQVHSFAMAKHLVAAVAVPAGVRHIEFRNGDAETTG